MQGWQTSYLGLRDMPGDISEFEREHRLNFAALSAGSPFVAMIWMSAM